jgi:hypothetical protein
MRSLVVFFVGLCACCCVAQDGVGTAVRAELNLNNNWNFVLNQTQDQIPTSGWQTTRVPAMPIEDGTTSVWYEQSLNVRSTWVQPGRRYFLRVGKAGHYAAVYWNGILMGQHFGQFSPFEIEITNLVAGNNVIDIYVHKADTKYVRAGVTIDQSSCPPAVPDCIGNSYRSHALQGPLARNWVGLAGDLTFSWRTQQYIADVFPATSVRNKTITVSVKVTGNVPAATAKATVMDGSTVVLALPAQTVTTGMAVLSSPWTNPVLWGQPPYGQPKLYTLRTDLLDSSGHILDTRFDRFGFREVWVSGKDVLLNGLRLWAAGEYPSTISPVVYVNDRRPAAFFLHIMEQSGFTSFSGHWDDLDTAMLDEADEMGILIVGSVYCSGPANISQVQVDNVSGWTGWMTSTMTEWVQAVRNHPSIVMWRPTDILPPGINPATAWPKFAAAVRAADTTGRPIADGSDVDWWDEEWGATKCNDGSRFANKLSHESKPLFTKEVNGTLSLSCLPSFFDTFYGLSYGTDSEGAVGFHLGRVDLFDYKPFPVRWFSISGQGNRPSSSAFLPNWIARSFVPAAFDTQFASLFQTYTGLPILNTSPTSGEYQASAIPSGTTTAFLSSLDGTGNPVGVEVAGDGSGTAWFVVPSTGNYTLSYNPGSGDVDKNVTVTAPPPF